MDQLSQLKALTVVSADTADINAFEALQPHDATTNPSFVLVAGTSPQYRHLLEEAIKYAKERATGEDAVELALDRISVNLGNEIAKKVPGYVSTEVDVRQSFSTTNTIARALRIIKMYEEDYGVSRDRILIKIAGTWHGIMAGRELEKQGIRTNITLVFSLVQAVFAAQSGCTLISPFVGRILDWHKKAHGVSEYAPEADPGVLSVREIYAYYKKHGHQTIVMGASFRNLDEIRHLAGVDRLTIAPKLLEQLQACNDPLPKMLDPADPALLGEASPHLGEIDEAKFYWLHNENACASDKLAEGIRAFGADTLKLEAHIKQHM